MRTALCDSARLQTEKLFKTRRRNGQLYRALLEFTVKAAQDAAKGHFDGAGRARHASATWHSGILADRIHPHTATSCLTGKADQ